MKKIFLAFLILSAKINFSEAQSFTISRSIEWSDTMKKVVMNDATIHTVFKFKGAAYDIDEFSSSPYYYENIKLPVDGDLQVSLTNVISETIIARNENADAENFPDDFKIISGKGYLQKQPYAIIQVGTIRKNKSGLLEKLISFDLNIQINNSGDLRNTQSRVYSPHSVLAAGTWYKISVSQDGVFKMDKNFLTTLGIDVTTIDPRNIKIFGNGGGMLPEASATFRYDDLQENAIYVAGESDGVFNDTDYVLFFGQSPNIWMYDQTQLRFVHKKNLYSDVSSYFISIGSSAGLRIQSRANSTSSPNKFISVFDDYLFHESDLKNLVLSGKEWFGEEFEYIPQRTFSFSFPNIETGSTSLIRASLASRSTQSSSAFNLKVNGVNIGDSFLSSVSNNNTDYWFRSSTMNGTFTATTSNINAMVSYTQGAPDANGWLNYIEVNAKRNLIFSGQQMQFRSLDSWGAGNISQFTISAANSNLLIWDVTNPLTPVLQNGNLNANIFQFTLATDTLHQFISFDGSSYLTPTSIGEIANQDLHGLPPTKFVILTPPQFLAAATRLQQYHLGIGQTTEVVTTDEVFNEFSSGVQDVSAIRDFMKMFYDRAGVDTSKLPKYLLLFGDGSYDYKNRLDNNTNFIPTFASAESSYQSSTYITDDYFGLLDDNEGGNIDATFNKLDIAVGRIPADSITEAEAMVDKILNYKSPASYGNWRNNITFVSDDDDQDGLGFTNDSQNASNDIRNNFPKFNIDKIYLDAYKQVTLSGGARYPDVNSAINHKIFTGTLVMNFIGHGGTVGWTHERVMGMSDFTSLTNYNKLALFVTATCDFTAFDNPAGKSAGEVLLLNPNGGAIGLVSTVRLVFSGENFNLDDNFLNNVYKPVNGRMPTLGECYMIGKNLTTTSNNNHKFNLFGDPAITLDYPQQQVFTSSISHSSPAIATDTLKALDKITITGFVADGAGNKLTNFNGTVYPTVFDKWVTYHTLQNDAISNLYYFQLQNNILFNGKVSVHNGDFTFSFIVPKDIQYNFGKGKISYYADNGVDVDANGFDTSMVVGGTSTNYTADDLGPELKPYMNDTLFVFGGITDANPTILLKLKDISGINTTSNGLGHDITGVLDGNVTETFSMNDFYETDLDSYQKGSVHYPLYNLALGEHTLSVKAWDVFNNSAEGYTEFIVEDNAQMALAHVLNYPNPFTTHTEFMFDENFPGSTLDVKVEIYSVTGTLIKTIRQTVIPDGYHVNGIEWDGLDDYGDLIGKGVYIYRVHVQNENGLSAQQFEKLVILR